MANPEHLKILKQGVEQWNKWRAEHPEMRPDLSEADLVEADLSGANLGLTEISRANLGRAVFKGTDLRGAALALLNLHGANLQGAHLTHTDLRGANLRRANLREATLSQSVRRWPLLIAGDGPEIAELRRVQFTQAVFGGADFSGADLTGTDFSGARAGRTHFDDVNLAVADGLESIHHIGPSYISIGTIYKSYGKLPEVFLRGCGVPDEFIAYIGSMVGRRFEFYSCFISYSTKDQEFAERLHAD